ncbi:fumarylacetoacetate hydrolase family protein [Alteraurantiacibacter aquimixticola]|uniref:Fumarylacetoacetate hydrolase n=1 Tax=Alteraurantiacibacter aquimixticola TaxID=2489173 RepID=A0A4T3F192_9SPHN|nr:fumarylacetoacetate hydrolase family protein [Alteraurantiacibacter aquimixticola]TIX50916.1 fumarylacetoacetate hydrolase [Alteraurantiacibacter aquimixticola]
MRLATRDNGMPDGELVLVSGDGSSCLPAGAQWPNLLGAIERWGEAAPALQDLSVRLAAGEGEPLAPASLRAPLPRSWQWLDGSVFDTHAKLMQVAFGTEPIENARPLMYQGMSDRFLGPCEDVPFLREEDGIDFEGEFGVIVDHVPMGTSAEEAMAHIKLIVQINDWSLRAYAVPEMKTGFGFILAKPACSMAPFAVTPDELGENWQDGRVCLDLLIDWNGERFGSASGREMDVGFHELVAHAATSRDLVAGTIIGSGTVANEAYAEVGSSCISERRAIEIIAEGKPTTGFMRFGDRVQMDAVDIHDRHPFGAIDQQITRGECS